MCNNEDMETTTRKSADIPNRTNVYKLDTDDKIGWTTKMGAGWAARLAIPGNGTVSLPSWRQDGTFPTRKAAVAELAIQAIKHHR